MVASIPLPCTARSRPASARKDPGEATEGSAAVVSSSDRLLLEPSSLRTAALCTGAGSLPLDTGIGTHDHLGAALATSQIAPRGRSLIGLLQRSILTESIALRQKSISSGRKAGLASPGNPLDGHTERVEDAASPSWSNRAPRHVSCSLRSTCLVPWLLHPQATAARSTHVGRSRRTRATTTVRRASRDACQPFVGEPDWPPLRYGQLGGTQTKGGHIASAVSFLA